MTGRQRRPSPVVDGQADRYTGLAKCYLRMLYIRYLPAYALGIRLGCVYEFYCTRLLAR